MCFLESNFLPEEAGSCQLAARDQETAKATMYARACKRVKEAGGTGGGRTELRAAGKRLYFLPGILMPEHQSHLTLPAFNDLG